MKVALYIKIPKIEDAQNTIKQTDELKDFASTNDWEIVEEIKDYLSGSKATTYSTKQLINLAKTKQIQKVLVYDITQFGKNFNDTYKTIIALCQHGISIFDYSQKNETLDDAGHNTIYAKAILPVFQQLSNQWKIEHSDKIKIGTKKAKKKGVKIGRPKQGKQKKEDEIIRLRNRGSILIDDNTEQKASYENIAKYLKVSKQTVVDVCRKHDLSKKVNYKVNKNQEFTKNTLYICKYQSSFKKDLYLQLTKRKVISHPDILDISFKDTKEDIGSKLKAFLVYKPIVLKRKALVVEGIDLFTSQQQEVFLKFIEEGKADCYLTASNTFRIQSALLSRVNITKYKAKTISSIILGIKKEASRHKKKEPEPIIDEEDSQLKDNNLKRRKKKEKEFIINEEGFQFTEQDLKGYKKLTSFAELKILTQLKPIISKLGNNKSSLFNIEKKLENAIKELETIKLKKESFPSTTKKLEITTQEEKQYPLWYILDILRTALLEQEELSGEKECMYHGVDIKNMDDLRHFLRMKYWFNKV